MDKYLLSNSTKMDTARTCAACKQPIMSTSVIKCDECVECYHPICVKATSSDTSKIKDWKCPSCRASEPRNCNLNTPVLASDRLESPSENNAATPRAHKRPALSSPCTQSITQDDYPDIATELRLIRLGMEDMKCCLQSLSYGMASCTARLDDFDSRIRALEERDAVLSALREEVSQLNEKLNHQMQIALNKEIEIIDVPETPNENLEHITMVTASKIGVNLSEIDLDWVTRAGPKYVSNNGIAVTHPRPIIVRLVRKNKRDEILKAGRARRHVLTTADLGLPNPPQKMYINEHLSKSNRLLFRAARARAKTAGYRFCWVSNGKIHLRREEGKPAVPIKTQTDLDRLLPGNNEKNCQATPTTYDQHA